MQATIQIDDALTVRGFHQPAERPFGRLSTLDSATSPIAETSKVDCLIDATKPVDYVPTKAQLLAAELAEELYGAQVTFVQADPSTFRELVQRLTGPETSSVANIDQNQSVRAPPSFLSDTETSSDSDGQSRRSADHRAGYESTTGRQVGSEDQQHFQAASSSMTRSSDIERSSSCSTGGSPGRLHATSGLGPRRNSAFKHERRQLQAAKKMDQLGLSFNILSTCENFVSSRCSSPLSSPLAFCETYESSPTQIGQGNSPYNNSFVSPTTRLFRERYARGDAVSPEARELEDMQMTALRFDRDYPSSPCYQNSRQMWQPQLLSLFPESPSQR